MSGKVSLEELGRFFRCLSVMSKCGITVHESLEHLKHDESLLFSETINGMIRALHSGSMFSGAIRMHPGVFPRFCADFIEAGERSGSMVQTMDRLSVYLERTAHLQRRFVAAMTYPFIVLLLSVGMMLSLVWFIFPREQALLHSLGVETPFITRVLFVTLGFLFHPAVVMIALTFAVAIFVLFQSRETSKGKEAVRKVFDRAVLRIPVLGDLVWKFATAKTLSAFATLIEAGNSLDQSLVCTSRLTGNSVLEDRLKDAIREVRDGETFSDALKKNECLPELAVHLLHVAEESGGLPKMSAQVARIFEKEVEDAIDLVSTLVEPIALMITGLFIGALLLATLLPTTSIVGNL